MLLEEIFQSFGTPNQLLTDYSIENVNIMKEILGSLYNNHTPSFHHPQNNKKLKKNYTG